jgi:hypothetical protein
MLQVVCLTGICFNQFAWLAQRERLLGITHLPAGTLSCGVDVKDGANLYTLQRY